MNRCLHVTIHENAKATPRRATASRPGRLGTDPASEYLMPPIDDPASEYLMPPIDDPAAEYLMPPIDDPASEYLMPPIDDPNGSRYGGSGGGEAAATVHSSSSCCGCGAQAGACPPKEAATPHPFIAPRDFSGFVIVRMAQGIDPNAGSLWELANHKERLLPGLKAALELPFKDKEDHLTSRPLVELLQGEGGGAPLERETCLDRIRELEKQTALTAFPPLQSLTAYWRLDLREHPRLVKKVVARLNRLAEVDLAYRELAASDPEASDGKTFAADQGYLSDAPAGIGASWAWKGLATPDSSVSGTTNPRSASLTICDLEQGWNPEHNDLIGENVLPGFIYGENRNLEGIPGHHGTAVLGQLVAVGRGAAADLRRFALASHYLSKDKNKPHPFAGTNGHVAAALAQALEVPGGGGGPLRKGDILLLEVQRGLLPAEVDEADFNAIRLASGLGILVIEAAGNGGFDLDAWSDPNTGRRLRRGDSHFRDSGAVLVGAARASAPHDRYPFSNYGSRLDCYGWGEAVTTCGYGDLAGTTTKDFYTNSFSGTSSASPIIAGAAALLQALHKKEADVALEPRAMRSLLSDPATGTPQGLNVPGHIGVMPDLKAILRERLQLVPVVYMRRSVCDDGSKPGLDDEISSSPDIFFWQGPRSKAKARYEEGNGRENLPAPGNSFVVGSTNQIYVRLRNRGLGKGEARVHLFASPAATLITPEHWIPWGFLDVVDPTPGPPTGIIPQGDTLFVAGPVPPVSRLTDPDSDAPWSFLAVLSQLGECDPSRRLPPTSPYFDWAQYRAFLRQPGVAWRNTHRVAAPTASLDLHLPFFIAGTPDRARLFDFEVIQRLPADSTVTLTVLTALDAKLRQRQPWLGDRTGPLSPLSLPKRPRTAIQGVALAAKAYADASFTVQAPANTLTASHSLAIRQLWRGEEVGRITWYFGLDCKPSWRERIIKRRGRSPENGRHPHNAR